MQAFSTAGSFSATVDWGDGSAPTAAQVVANGAGFDVESNGHVYAEAGDYAVTVVVDIGDRQIALTNLAVIDDVPLTAAGVNVGGVAGAETGLVAVAAFADANPFASAGDFTAGIHWGDGSPETPGIVAADGSGGFLVLGNHAYASPGAYSISVTIDDFGGESATTASLATVQNLTYAGSVQPTHDVAQGDLIALGEAGVDLNTGSLRLSHALDFDRSPGTAVGGDPALVYNSATVSARPILELAFTGLAGAAPLAAHVQLTWGEDGAPQQWVNAAIQAQGGGVYRLTFQAAEPAQQSGHEEWRAHVRLVFATGPVDLTVSGEANVIVNENSPFGAGWDLAGTAHLVFACDGGILMAYGNGDSRWFGPNGQGGYLSPPEDFGALVGNYQTGYTYTTKDQVHWNFDIWGRLVSVALGTFTVFLVYCVGLRWGRPAAFLAVCAMAVQPQHVRESHFALTDTPLTFFIALTMLLSLRASEQASARPFVYAGMAAGLAAATTRSIAASYGCQNSGRAPTCNPCRAATVASARSCWLVNGRPCPSTSLNGATARAGSR